ncbi:TPA: hypothetical protein HA251_01495 [Candidatus Woesearchaeota archaeon]|nr:hypothetical protein [Candidatus Woesearchaeota archaeon]
MRKEDYSDSEWALLAEVPHAIFAYVAIADGKVEAEELRFQAEWISAKVPRIKFSSDRTLNLFMQGVFQHSRPSRSLHEYDDARLRDVLRGFHVLMAKRSPGERTMLCRAFSKLAQEVADAAGPFYGSRVTKSEQKAVDNIISWL